MISNFIKNQKQVILEFRNFMIVGVLSTIVNYSIFFILSNNLHIYYITASAVGFIVGIFISYSLNRMLTFSSNSEKMKAELLMYILVCLFSLVLSSGILWFFVEYVGLSPLVANVLGIGVSTMSNFIGAKFIVFKKKSL